MMEENRRVRLVFDGKDGILSETQKAEGLERCWVLLKPRHRTIDDLTSFIFQAFQLHSSCPHGLLLYMDDFLLPPFESVDILERTDIISVKKKAIVLSLEGNNATNFVKELETLDKHPTTHGQLLLADEEFEKETGGYQCDEREDESKEEDDGESADEFDEVGEVELLEDSSHQKKSSGGKATSRKRKALEKLQGSKKKKLCAGVQENIQNDAPKKVDENLHQDGCVGKGSFHVQEDGADVKKKTIAANKRKKAESSSKTMEAPPDTKGTDQLQKNVNELQNACGGTRKVPSRSARRKKAKRRWIREMAKIQKQAGSSQSEGLQNWKETQAKGDRNKQSSWKQKPAQTERKKHNSTKEKQAKHLEKDPNVPKGLLHWKPWSGNDTLDGARKEEQNQNGRIPEHTNQKIDMENEVVPVVIRPGHIRFEPQEKDQVVKQSQPAEESFQWNGITSKRHGQKWGTEKFTHSQRKENGNLNIVHSDVSKTPKEIHSNDSVDFDKLPSLSSLPQPGDIIGYRLLELSSSWTPELSSYQVGQVSWCNSESGKLLLMPVSEYPITSGKLGEDGSDMPPDNSRYKEDGSLEIDFSTLVDVRVVKSDNGVPSKAAVGSINGGPVDTVLWTPPANKDKKEHASAPENGVDPWEQISEVLSAKKAQLSRESTWGKTSSIKGSWSYRAMKGSALGPTMALLRSKNKL